MLWHVRSNQFMSRTRCLCLSWWFTGRLFSHHKHTKKLRKSVSYVSCVQVSLKWNMLVRFELDLREHERTAQQLDQQTLIFETCEPVTCLFWGWKSLKQMLIYANSGGEKKSFIIAFLRLRFWFTSPDWLRKKKSSNVRARHFGSPGA